MYCSPKCRVINSRTTDSKFVDKVDKNGPVHPILQTKCWCWKGYIHGDGYGVIVVLKKGVLAHRKAWEIWVGPIENDLRVLHKCDNRRCVNPSHLFLGTDIDNVNDRDQKGRQVKGEASHLSKLTEEQAIVVRRRYDQEVIMEKRKGAIKDIATEFNISESQVTHIGKRWCWKHLLEKPCT